jgi:hypothetical protein
VNAISFLLDGRGGYPLSHPMLMCFEPFQRFLRLLHAPIGSVVFAHALLQTYVVIQHRQHGRRSGYRDGYAEPDERELAEACEEAFHTSTSIQHESSSWHSGFPGCVQ